MLWVSGLGRAGARGAWQRRKAPKNCVASFTEETRLTNLPDKWLQCQANGSNVCRVLREDDNRDHARPFEPQSKVIFEDFANYWRWISPKWLQERGNDFKIGVGMTHERPCVGPGGALSATSPSPVVRVVHLGRSTCHAISGRG